MRIDSFQGPFVFDDLGSISENPHISRLWPIWEISRAHPVKTVAGRPVLGLSLALNYQISGPKVWSYHVVKRLDEFQASGGEAKHVQ